MKKQFRKILSLALIAVLSLTVFLPVQTVAAEEIQKEYVQSLSFDFEGETRPSQFTGGTIVADPISDFYNDKVLRKETSDIGLSGILEAGKTYKVKFYFYAENTAEQATSKWFAITANTWNSETEKFEWVNTSGSGYLKQWNAGSYELNKWNVAEFTIAIEKDRSNITFKTDGVVFYFDNFEISVVSENGNTAEVQTYDFDNVNFKAYSDKAKNSIEMIAINGKKNSVTKLSPTSSAMAKINVELDYALQTGKYYKLSFDYKGTAQMRLLHNFGAWANLVAIDAIKENAPNTSNDSLYTSGDGWKKYDTVFYTEQASTHLYFLLAQQTDTDFYIDNIKLEMCDAEGSTVTAFPVKHKVDFEDAYLDSLNGVSADSGYTLAADPINPSNTVLKHTGGYGSFFVQDARLKADHEYTITYDYYVPTQSDSDPGIRNNLRTNLGAKITPDNGWTNTWSSKDVWKQWTGTITTANDGAFFQLYVLREIYIDNIVIRDITPDSYYSDYEDEEIFFESDTSRTDVTYEQDDTYGKVAKITYAPVSALGGFTKFPVKLKDGEAYKVTFTYKTSAWATVHYSAKSVASQWSIDSKNWKTVTYYVTGTGDDDYFGFRCNNASEPLNIWIAEVQIERKTATNDLNADGVSDWTDLSLLRTYLLGGRNDLKFFEKFTEQDGVEGVDICDLVALCQAINA